MINNKVLIIGSGAREQAIALALSKSLPKPSIYCCGPSLNPAIQALTRDYSVGKIHANQNIVDLAKMWEINLAIIGPEAPLENGLADFLWDAGIPVIGPKKSLARIETSKSFARELMKKYNIPGLPEFGTFTNFADAERFLKKLGENNYVIKCDGLMGGKGVKVGGEHLQTFAAAQAYCKTILDLNQTIIIEEKLIGQEFSFMGFCDGKTLLPMPIVQDHKRAYVADKGPNTGGMGSYSDANHRLPFLTSEDASKAWEINEAVLQALTQECNEAYMGILYGSFIATKQGIYVIEFNARFGDPEALNVLSILKSDFYQLCEDMVRGSLKDCRIDFANQATVCKYAVPEGYPDAPLQNIPIDIAGVEDKSNLYLAAVHHVEGNILATGSRTAAYVGVGETITVAEQIAERGISQVIGRLFHREDIGKDSLIQQRIAMMQQLRASLCA